MRTIPLTQGQVTLVDDEDFDRFGHLKWFAQWNECTKSFYARRMAPTGGETGVHTGKGKIKQKMVALHREILGLTDSTEKGDHRDHNTLDNRRENLRSCTASKNGMNRKGSQKTSTSGIRGVRWHKQAKQWNARISVNGKLTHLGLFRDKADAVSAYTTANRLHFGEFGGVL